MSTPNVGITNNPVLVTKGDPIRVEVRPTGTPGAPGEGVPPGGTTGQVLAKKSATDYDTEWVDNDPDGVQSVTGDGVDNTDPANPVMTFPTAGEIGAIPASEKGAASGVATLGADGKVVFDESIIDPYQITNGGNVQYLGYPFSYGISQIAIGNNSTHIGGCPIWVPKPFAMDGVVFTITIGQAGSQINAYLYDMPDDITTDSTQLASLGSALTATSGIKVITFSPITLQRGWHVIGLQGTTTGSFPNIQTAAIWARPANATNMLNRSDGLWGPNTVPPPASHRFNLLGIGTNVLCTIRGTYL